MKQLFTLIISLSFICCVIAQNYQLLRSDRILFYEGVSSLHSFNCIKIDSTQIVNQDSIFYPSPTIYQVSENCYEPFGPTLLGDKIAIQANGHSLLFNKHGDTIPINTKAEQGESWIIALPNLEIPIRAAVTDHKVKRFLGSTDSVKTIQFQPVNEADTAKLSIFGLNIKLSKNYGLIQSVDFREFPDAHWNSNFKNNEHHLLGLTNPARGVQNLTWFDVFDFQVGDEFHKISWSDGSQRKRIEKILDREDNLNEEGSIEQIIYTIQLESSITHFLDSIPFYNIDTFKKTIRWFIPNHFDSLPGLTYNREVEYNYGIEYTQYRMFFYKEMLTKVPPINHVDHICFTDSCWTTGYCVIDGSESDDRYIKGLGGPYYERDGFHGDYYTNELIYYDKGGKIWGTPLDLTSVENVKPEESTVEIFPNPAKNNFTFITSEKYMPLILTIVDLNGKVVWNVKVHTVKTKIPVHHLNEGLYFVSLNHQDYTFPVQKLLINP